MIETFSFDDILIYPKEKSRVESRSMVDTSRLLYDTNLAFPIISASMSLFDTTKEGNIYVDFAYRMAELEGMHIFSRATPLEQRLQAADSFGSEGLNVGIAVSWQEFQKHQGHLERLNSFVSIDIANGAIIKEINWNGHKPLIVGNFGNPYVYGRDDLKGDIVFKFGIGSGAGCSTREVTGVGAPQGWLVRQSYQAKTVASDNKYPIISDGGVKSVGDFAKALALGADAVMVGRLLAAADETPWEPVKVEGKWYKPYRGMASAEEKGIQSHVEGVSGLIPYEGKTLKILIQEIKDGVTSAMSYSDALNMEEFIGKADILRTPNIQSENGTRLYT